MRYKLFRALDNHRVGYGTLSKQQGLLKSPWYNIAGSMKAKIKLIDGIALAGTSDSNHWITLDGPEEFGGFSAGPRPMELMLMGLAGCAGMDVLSILRKKRVKLNDFSMEVEAERAEDHPRVFTRIKLNYIFSGKNILPSDIERSIALTEEKYCGATAMLKKSVEIIHNYRILESE